MKSFLLKLIAGTALCLCLAAALGVSRAQPSQTTTAVAPLLPPVASTVATFGDARSTPMVPTVATSGDARSTQIVVCGACGSEIAQPRAVLIAEPVGQPRQARGSFYGIPPVGYLPQAMPMPAEVYGYGYPPAYYLETFRPGAPEESYPRYGRDVYARPAPAVYGVPAQQHRHDVRRSGRERRN